MFKFHITGFAGNGVRFWDNLPIDITVFAESLTKAIGKAETILGFTISTIDRKVVVEELVGVDNG